VKIQQWLIIHGVPVFSFNDITSVVDAEARMEKLLDARSVPFLTGKIKLKDEEVEIGELIKVIDTRSIPQINQKLVVSKIKYIYPSPYEEIEIGDKEWKLEDDIVELENRVKRLEENFIRNQDLLLQLIRLEDTGEDKALFPTERYLKAIKQEYNTTYGGMIYGNPTYGIWGTHKWGEKDDIFEPEEETYVSNYGNYVETFVDEDFEDEEETTAEW